MDTREGVIVTLQQFTNTLNRCIGSVLEAENFPNARSEAITQARALALPRHLIERLVHGEPATYSTALRADIDSALIWG